MKKIILILMILISGYYIASIYIDLKITASNEISHLKKENKVLQHEINFSIYREAIIYLNSPKISQSLQIATAGVYFCTINKKTTNFFLQLNAESHICTNWSKETKGMYEKYFSDVNISMDINCVSKGLDIVNNICLSNIE